MLYRHWLELRWRWCFVLLMSMLIGVSGPTRLAHEVAEFERTGKLSFGLQPYAHLLEPLGAYNLHLWSLLVNGSWGAMQEVAFMIFIFNLATSTQQKDYLLLSLPVSRQRALWTRFAFECVELAAAAAFMLALAAMQSPHPLPWNILLLSCTMAWIGTLPLLAALKMVSTATSSWTIAGVAGIVCLLPVLAIAVRVLHSSLDVILDPSLIAHFVLWSTLGLGIFCSLTAYAANQREY